MKKRGGVRSMGRNLEKARDISSPDRIRREKKEVVYALKEEQK